MYRAIDTGIVKINRLPPSFFDQLFAVRSVEEVHKLITSNISLLNKLVNDESLPKTTRGFLSDMIYAAKRGRFNETMALKVVPLLYSMSTRAGGNTQVLWTVFARSKRPGMQFSEKPRKGGKYADYALDPTYLQVGNDVFKLLDKSGRRVIIKMSKGLLHGKLIPWARVDYRTARPIRGKHTFAIIDVGMGSVGTFEKDVIASLHGVESNISAKLVDSILSYHVGRMHTKPKNVVIALSSDYFNEKGAIVRSMHDLKGLQKRFLQNLGHSNVFLLPYPAISIGDSLVSFYARGRNIPLGKSDLLFIYNPNKPMEEAFERAVQKHMNVISSRRFAAISDKRVNRPFILAAKLETKTGKVIIPRRGPLITAHSLEELRRGLIAAGRQLGGTGIVVKLPLPIEVGRKALPSALFFNPMSELQLTATEHALRKHFAEGARVFSTEELIRPHSIPGREGGLELRFYYSGRGPFQRRHFRR